jgi:hypothetical protein
MSLGVSVRAGNGVGPIARPSQRIRLGKVLRLEALQSALRVGTTEIAGASVPG